MTDAAFLQAIIEHPDDDGARLVYADWLEERGDPRGAFIRVQCELAKIEDQRRYENHSPGVPDDPPCACPACEHRDTLRCRERELLEPHFSSWLPQIVSPQFNGGPTNTSLVCRIGGMDCVFRRGFVEEVALDWPTWGGGVCRECRARIWAFGGTTRRDCEFCHGLGSTPGHADAIRAATPLRKVRLTTFPNIEGTTALVVKKLAAKWPGIEFELPAERDISDEETAFTPADAARVLFGTGINQPQGIILAQTRRH